MARKNDDNFYRRQQDEANRLAATQNRHLNEIAKLAKNSVEEMRKMRRAFEAFSEAMLGMKIEPFQGAVLSEAARGQIAEFDIKGFKETLLKGEALTVPEGKPYPKVDFTPKPGGEKRVEYVERTPRLCYGDVIEANDDFIKTELADLGLVIGVDLDLDDPAQHALVATRGAVESNDRLVVICDELATRELLLAVEHERDSRLFGIGEEDEAVIAWQRVVLVERIREKVAESERARVATIREKLAIVDEAPAGTVEAAIQEAIDNGEHPPALDGLDVIDDSDLPACGFCGDNVGLPECPAHGEVLPPGVTPKMMADHPEFAERVRRTPHYHQANQYASGGYTGVGLGENVVGGIVHQGIFSDTTIPEKNTLALSQYAADAERQRRDGLASY